MATRCKFYFLSPLSYVSICSNQTVAELQASVGGGMTTMMMMMMTMMIIIIIIIIIIKAQGVWER